MRLFTVLLFALALITTQAHANTAVPAPSRSVFDKVADALKNPSKARKIFNPTSIAAQIAFDKLLEGIDYVMNEGAEVQQKDKEANKNEQSSNAQSSYPYEYFVDGKVFSSPEAAHSYVTSDAFLAKYGYKRTRRNDGLYYDKLYINYSGMSVYHYVQVGARDTEYTNNVGGGVQAFYSKIYLVGTLSDKEVHRNDEQAEKERKRKIVERLARQYEADLAEAQANNPDKDQDETKDKPKTGTGTAIQAGTGAGEGTGTKDEAEATTQSGTGTKKDEKDKDNQKDKELPTFCNWAKTVCDFVDWFKTEPDYPDSELPEQDIPIKAPAEFDRDYVRANAQCPADVVVPLNMGFATHELVFSFNPICDFVRIYLSKVILFIAYFFATLHISSAFKV